MRFASRKAVLIVAVLAAVAALIGGTTAAMAANTSAAIPAGTIHGCVDNSTRTLTHVYTINTNGTTCPSGTFLVYWNQKGTTGAAGPKGSTGPQGIQGPKGDTGSSGTNGTNGADGATGPQGAQGPSGVVGIDSNQLVSEDSSRSITTGGGFVANATETGTVDLKAGSYLMSLNAKATPNAATTGQVFPQFFIYNQVKNSSFNGDLLNIGAGALEPFGTNHDSYYSGYTIITLPVDTTLHIYSFGYDSDSGGGSYQLDSLTLDTVQVNPSS